MSRFLRSVKRKALNLPSIRLNFGLLIHSLELNTSMDQSKVVSIRLSRQTSNPMKPWNDAMDNEGVRNTSASPASSRFEWGKTRPLHMMSTLVRDKSTRFQSKVIKLTFLLNNSGKIIPLGFVTLDLRTCVLADGSNFIKHLTLQLEKCSHRAVVKVSVYSRKVALKMAPPRSPRSGSSQRRQHNGRSLVHTTSSGQLSLMGDAEDMTSMMMNSVYEPSVYDVTGAQEMDWADEEVDNDTLQMLQNADFLLSSTHLFLHYKYSFQGWELTNWLAANEKPRSDAQELLVDSHMRCVSHENKSDFCETALYVLSVVPGTSSPNKPYLDVRALFARDDYVSTLHDYLVTQSRPNVVPLLRALWSMDGQASDDDVSQLCSQFLSADAQQRVGQIPQQLLEEIIPEAEQEGEGDEPSRADSVSEQRDRDVSVSLFSELADTALQCPRRLFGVLQWISDQLHEEALWQFEQDLSYTAILEAEANTSSETYRRKQVPSARGAEAALGGSWRELHNTQAARQHCDSALESTKRLIAFLQRICEQTDDFARALTRTCDERLHEGRDSDFPSIKAVWSSVTSNVLAEAAHYQDSVSQVQTRVIAPLVRWQRNAEKELKAVGTAQLSATDKLKECLLAVHNNKAQAQRLLERLAKKRKAELVRVKSGDTFRARLDRSIPRNDQEPAIQDKLYKVSVDYRDAIETYNKSLEYFNVQTKPTLLSRLEHLERSRVTTTRKALKAFRDNLNSKGKRFSTLSHGVARAVKDIDVQWELQHYVFTANSAHRLPSAIRYMLDATPEEIKAGNYHGKKAKPKPISLLFQIPLSAVPSTAKVPIILKTLAAAVERNQGAEKVGIFRLSAATEALTKLRQELEEEARLPRDQLADAMYKVDDRDPVIFAALLKEWLRELPEPLIPSKMYGKCLQLAKDAQDSKPGDGAVRTKIIQTYLALPEVNRNVVKLVAQLSHKIAEGSAVNLMTMDNLAIVFAPTCLRNPDEDPMSMFANTTIEKRYMALLLRHVYQCTRTDNKEPVMVGQDEPCTPQASSDSVQQGMGAASPDDALESSCELQTENQTSEDLVEHAEQATEETDETKGAEAEPTEPNEPTETEQMGQMGQMEQMEQIEQIEQIEQTEQIEQIEQIEQTEQTEQVQIEQQGEQGEEEEAQEPTILTAESSANSIPTTNSHPTSPAEPSCPVLADAEVCSANTDQQGETLEGS